MSTIKGKIRRFFRIISSIPTTASPAVNTNVVIGVEAKATNEPGELSQIKIIGQVANEDQSSSSGVSSKVSSVGVNAQADEFDFETRAKVILGRSLSVEETVAIQRAHDVGPGHYLGRQNLDGTYEQNENPDLAYSFLEIAEKARILRAAGLNPEEIRKLMKYGIAGKVMELEPTSVLKFTETEVLSLLGEIWEELNQIAKKEQIIQGAYRLFNSNPERIGYSRLPQHGLLESLRNGKNLRIEIGPINNEFFVAYRDMPLLHVRLGRHSNELAEFQTIWLHPLLRHRNLGTRINQKIFEYLRNRGFIYVTIVPSVTSEGYWERYGVGSWHKGLKTTLPLDEIIKISSKEVPAANAIALPLAPSLREMPHFEGTPLVIRNVSVPDELFKMLKVNRHDFPKSNLLYRVYNLNNFW